MKSRFFHSRLGTALCLSVFALGVGMAQQPPDNGSTVYAITDLGTLPGYQASDALGINNNGQVVGYSTKDDIEHAFLWQNGQMTDLGTLPGYNSSRAVAINDQGQVVGTVQNGSGANSNTRAFLWQDGHMTDLGTLGGSVSSVGAINNLGQIAGDSTTADGDDHAFRWQDGHMTDIGTLGETGTDIHATGINDQGQIVGYSNYGEYAFIWQDGQMTNLGKPGPDYDPIAPAPAPKINNNGQVAIGEYGPDGAHVFLWQNGKFTDLGSLGYNTTDGPAGGINDSGQVVGGLQEHYQTFHPYLAENGKVIHLDSLLLSGSDWYLDGYFGATGINNAGQIIGSGASSLHTNNQEHGYLLTPKPIVDATLQISPSPFTFGPVRIGQKSGPGTISIYNAGPQTAALANFQLDGGNTQFDKYNGPPEFSITGTTCGPTLAANASCTATLEFTPGGRGELTTFFVLNDNTQNGQQTVPVSGVGAYLLKFTRLSWQFPTRPVGETSGSYVEYVYNPTGSAVHFSSIQFSAINSGDFAITQNTCGSMLAPYTTCAVAFNFSPSAPGMRYGGLVFTDHLSDSPQSISVSGIAVSAPLKFSRLTWQFPTRHLGETSGSYVVYIYNPGSPAVRFTSIQFSGGNTQDFAITQNTCGSAVAPYTTCAVSFDFSPKATGERSTSIIFNDTSYGSPQIVSMSGYAVSK